MRCNEIVKRTLAEPDFLASSEEFGKLVNVNTSQSHNTLGSSIAVGVISDEWRADDIRTLLASIKDLPLSVTGVTQKRIPESSHIKPQCWVFRVECDNLIELRTRLVNLQLLKADVLVMPSQATTTKLACFDMDSTLIKVEVIDQLALHAGVGDKVSEITARAMRGELDFKESFTHRMALLKGLPASTIDTVKSSLPLMEGAEQLIKGLVSRGVYTAIFSGGFDVFAKHVVDSLGMDTFHANQLEIVNGVLTGVAREPSVDATLKRDLLRRYMTKLKIEPAATLAVGDGANDLLMLSSAGVGVAFHAKPLVQQQAEYALSTQDLSALLYLVD